MSKPKHIEFTADHLEMLSFKIISENTKMPEDFEAELISNYETTYETKLSYNLEKELIRSQYTISITTESDNKVEAKKDFDFVFIFRYHPIEEVYSEEDEQTKVSEQLGISITAITHSTVRGVLIVKLQDDIFGQYVLPIVKPQLSEVEG